MPGQIGLLVRSAGVMKHLDALTAHRICPIGELLSASLGHRLLGPGVQADWGYQNRTTARCASRRRVGSSIGRWTRRSIRTCSAQRAPQGLRQTASPTSMDPGKPELRNIYEAMEAGKTGHQAAHVPRRGHRGGSRSRRGDHVRPCPARCSAGLPALQAKTSGRSFNGYGHPVGHRHLSSTVCP